MSTDVTDILKRVALTGGDPFDATLLRHYLGAIALRVKLELRLIGLGCADNSTVERVESTLNASTG